MTGGTPIYLYMQKKETWGNSERYIPNLNLEEFFWFFGRSSVILTYIASFIDLWSFAEAQNHLVRSLFLSCPSHSSAPAFWAAGAVKVEQCNLRHTCEANGVSKDIVFLKDGPHFVGR